MEGWKSEAGNKRAPKAGRYGLHRVRRRVETIDKELMVRIIERIGGRQTGEAGAVDDKRSRLNAKNLETC